MLDQSLHEAKVTTEGGKVYRSASLMVLEGGVSSSLEEDFSTIFKPVSNLE